MRNGPDKSCRENQHTRFMLSNFLLPLLDNVETYGRARQATDDSIWHTKDAICMLDNLGKITGTLLIIVHIY
jgi:hypothetical protein